ncbi:mutS protein homolog 5 [Aphomia sociella]
MNEISSDNTSVTVTRQQVNASCYNNIGGTNESSDRFVLSKCRRNKDVTTNDKGNEEISDDSEHEERLLVVYCRSSKLGAAYYTLQTGELFVLEEIVDRPPEYQMFLNLFRQVEPAKILLEGKSQGTFIQTVKKTVFDCDASGRGSCKLIFLSAREYSFEACKRRIFTLSLPHEPAKCTEEDRILFIRTVVEFAHTQSVHALGALLRYVDLNWSSLSMELHSKPQFMSLRKISLADIVTIDEDTYRGLQIFSSVSHPSNFKKGVQGSNKEGLSLFHVFNKCSSKVGQSRMRVFLQHPTRDLAKLKRRQDVVAFFMRPQNEPTMKNICSSLRFIKNVNGILTKMKALSAKSYQWKSLYNTLYNAVLICEICENAGNSSEFLQQLTSCDNNKLYEMALYMNRIIDFDLSKSEGKFTVKAGVDPDLDMKKQTMASLHGLMSETAKVELNRLPSYIEECTMLYMPHLGYLLGVKAWDDDLTMEQKTLPNMTFMFQNNDYIHYKSKGCEELDVMIGDTYPEIVAHETRIMMRLTNIVLENLSTLADVIDMCAELDCLITISKVCKEHNFVRPIMTDEKIISIKQGKHPLYLMTSEDFVPNDAESSQEAGYVKILTGPNSSGKSVYMKQIALIVYLAHVGSFVPAARARVGATCRVASRLHAAQCVASHMSAFLADLTQMALALQESTSNSLIIIDEFGKGTSEVDGLSLLAACLNTLLFQGENCPHVFLSTHFLNIKEYIVKTPIVKFLSFEYVVQDGEPVFLFRIREGESDSSFALQVAAASGIQPQIIDRARVVLTSLMNNSLPPEDKKITAKLRTFTEIIKNELLTEDV